MDHQIIFLNTSKLLSSLCFLFVFNILSLNPHPITGRLPVGVFSIIPALRLTIAWSSYHHAPQKWHFSISTLAPIIISNLLHRLPRGPYDAITWFIRNRAFSPALPTTAFSGALPTATSFPQGVRRPSSSFGTPVAG